MFSKYVFKIITFILCLISIFSFGCNGASTPQEPEKNPLKYYEYSFEKFNEISEPIFKLPGCESGIEPQSISVWEERGWAFIGGYTVDSNGKQNPTLYIVDIEKGNVLGSYEIYNLNNTKHHSYIGGLACTSKNLFMSVQSKLFRMPLNQFSTPIINGIAQIVEEIDTPSNSALCSYANGKLWVGDFYTKDDSNLRKLPADRPKPVGKNLQGHKYYEPQPCAFGYDLEDTESEISWDKTTEKMGATPDYCVIIQEKIRGFTVLNDYAVFVSSFGQGNAVIYFKKLDLVNQQPNATTLINGVEIPTWDRGMYFNKNSQKGFVESVNAMQGALGITKFNNDLLLVFSSGTLIYSQPESIWKDQFATEYAWQIKFPSTLN